MSNTVPVKTVKKRRGRKQLPREVYNQLYEEYARDENIMRSAKAVGIDYSTAKRYILKGTNRYPAIQGRIQRADERAFAEQDKEMARVRGQFKTALRSLAKDQIKTLKRVQFRPKGRVLKDENGNIVRDENGDEILLVDEDTIFKIIQNMERLYQLISGINSDESGKPKEAQSGTQVNIGINFDREAVREEGESYLRMAGMYQVTDPATQRAAVLQEAARRTVDVTPK